MSFLGWQRSRKVGLIGESVDCTLRVLTSVFAWIADAAMCTGIVF